MAEESPAPQRQLLSSLLPTPRRSPLAAVDSDSDSDDAAAGAGSKRSGGGASLSTPKNDRFRADHRAALTSGQRKAFTGRSRELLLAKNAREASREKATLKQHCEALEEKIRCLESTVYLLQSEKEPRVEVVRLEEEVATLKADLTDARRSAYDVSRAAAAAAADSVSTEAHERVHAELAEARATLDAARAAAAAAQREHEDEVKALAADLEGKREDAVRAAVEAANEASSARAAENDEWLQRALQERTAGRCTSRSIKRSINRSISTP